ncbi:putative glycoside hydrolase [Leptospira yasudae]|uniref:Glycosyl hydrolase n=1 Tax=Leptospira yasudae TaxID=2202201 RepID=A0A6N4QJ70_9LEPT|nr:putative glycoside hydrolase [Leptospira yasudae]TGL74815.1 glycosyl hydrolase [Leptospira yasudae]TGL76798.1 glycosyl hydrolase [Leptospira yasudae]TGL78190.1 glycosyl hydrolase [Leptospira yasudae]
MKTILPLIFLFFFWPPSLFSDFDLPFPKRNNKKQIPEVIFRETIDMEVGSTRIEKKKVEDTKVEKFEKVPISETLSKVKIQRPEPDLRAKVDVGTPQQNVENSTRNSASKTILNAKVPEFSRGIYISQRTLKKEKEFRDLRRKGKQHGVNLLVIDVQPSAPSKEILEGLVEEGFYPVARVVNFDGGLPTEKPSNQRITSIHKSIRSACESGFPEIQLDYIRYADNLQLKLTYETRYKNISGIIKDIRNETLKCEHLPYIGADIFGRIPFNQNDMIGQKVEVFAQVVDVLYPMLYPSHFYGMPARIKDPYQTVYDGTLLTLKRSLKTTRVIPYIQGFNMSVGKSGLTLADYIKAQVKASYDSGGHGFVVWNAWNDYESTFQALKDYDKETKKD